MPPRSIQRHCVAVDHLYGLHPSLQSLGERQDDLCVADITGSRHNLYPANVHPSLVAAQLFANDSEVVSGENGLTLKDRITWFNLGHDLIDYGVLEWNHIDFAGTDGQRGFG